MHSSFIENEVKLRDLACSREFAWTDCHRYKCHAFPDAILHIRCDESDGIYTMHGSLGFCLVVNVMMQNCK